MDQRPTQPLTPPPDRGRLLTEQRNPNSMNLDTLGVEQCLSLINREDATIAASVHDAMPAIARVVRTIERSMRAGGRLVYVGAGTSGRLGVLDASECPPTFQTDPSLVVGVIAGGDASLRTSSEGKEDDPDGARDELERLDLGAHDTLLGIAAGGTTPYVLGALSIAKSRGASTALLCCSPITKPNHADELILVETGPEVLTGSTRMKAGTATKMVLNMISTTLMVQLGKTHENLMVDLRATNDKLRDRAARIVMELANLDREAALTLLERAGWHVKTALVMHARGLDRGGAAAALDAVDGRLRDALDA